MDFPWRSAVVRAHSLLHSFPEVDTERIGLTGISWGGYLTCIIASLDNRFRFAVPVYGCGFLKEDSGWVQQFTDLKTEKAARWTDLWDPSRYLPAVKLPMLWMNGTNDSAFPLSSWQKSVEQTQGDNTRCIQIDMPHGHPCGATPPEIHAYANGSNGLGKPLARIAGIQTIEGNKARLNFSTEVTIAKAAINFTTDDGPWIERKWRVLPAQLTTRSSAEAEIAADAMVFFINLIDERGLVVSSEYKLLRLDGYRANDIFCTSRD